MNIQLANFLKLFQMKLFTIATGEEGYFNLLKQSALRWGYDLEVLGWQQTWQGFAWKLELYIEALLKLPPEEPIICVDGYDVVVIAPADEMGKKFKRIDQPIVFSGQRYFPNQRMLQKLADQVMSNNLSKSINKGVENSKDYSRPCMGLMVAYAGDLLLLFQKLLEIEKENSLRDDQTLLNMYYLNHPNSIQVDLECTMFQNLWRTRGGIYGKIDPKDHNSEIEVIYDEVIESNRFRNKQHDTTPCFLHGPFNLDMGLLLEELKLDAPKMDFKKGRHYWSYSITHHMNRAIKLYFSSVKKI